MAHLVLSMQGYYLETCPKMRYKADFQPSQLLCMHTYAWVTLSLALPHLQQDSHCCIGMVRSFTLAQQTTFSAIALDLCLPLLVAEVWPVVPGCCCMSGLPCSTP